MWSGEITESVWKSSEAPVALQQTFSQSGPYLPENTSHLRETTAVCCENRMEHIKTLCGRNDGLMSVVTGCAYNYRCAMKVGEHAVRKTMETGGDISYCWNVDFNYTTPPAPERMAFINRGWLVWHWRITWVWQGKRESSTSHARLSVPSAVLILSVHYITLLPILVY